MWFISPESKLRIVPLLVGAKMHIGHGCYLLSLVCTGQDFVQAERISHFFNLDPLGLVKIFACEDKALWNAIAMQM